VVNKEGMPCQYVDEDNRCGLVQEPEKYGRREGYEPMSVRKGSEDVCNAALRGWKLLAFKDLLRRDGDEAWDSVEGGEEKVELGVECTDYAASVEGY